MDQKNFLCTTNINVLTIRFYKYHGTGNDFIILDQTSQQYLTEQDQTKIAHLCDRRFGIGADGLMFLELEDGVDFKMIYFNADGRTSSMCGNGGRCIVAFAHRLRLFDEHCTFNAIDGLHEASINKVGHVSLKMNDVKDIEQNDHFLVLDTGSPHYIQFDKNIHAKNVQLEGRSIRYNERFKEEGINVNFIEYLEPSLHVRTYERGVEDETFSCGTGVVASAISHALQTDKPVDNVKIKTKGGALSVSFNQGDDGFSNIWLHGPATFVYQGEIEI